MTLSIPTVRGGLYFGTRLSLAHLLCRIYQALFVEGRRSITIDDHTFDLGDYVDLVAFATELEALRITSGTSDQQPDRAGAKCQLPREAT